MALLDRFLPSWRHHDPKTRAAAVLELPHEAQDIFASIAQRDADPRVRRLALKRLEDPDLLLHLADIDTDEETRSLAAGRASEVLLHTVLTDADPQARSRAASRLTRTSSLVNLAIRGQDEDLALQAVGKITNPTALADVARRSPMASVGLLALQSIRDPILLARVAAAERSEVAGAAIERIASVDMLETLMGDPRLEKSARKRARTKLTQILGEQPLRAEERREQRIRLCARLEQMHTIGDIATAQATLREVELEWQRLTALAAAEADLEARYQQARNDALEALTRRELHEQHEQRRDAERDDAVRQRQELCEWVEGLDGVELAPGLLAAQRQWQALAPLLDRQGQNLHHRFETAIERGQKRQERWQERGELRRRMQELVDTAEQLYATSDAKSAARRLQLERRWATLEASAAGKKWMQEERDLQKRFVEAGYALHDLRRKQDMEKERAERAAVNEMADLCDQLEALGRDERLTPGAGEKALRASREMLAKSRTLPPVARGLEPRLQTAQEALLQRLNKILTEEDWKLWANADMQQGLIERAEALLTAADPRTMAAELGRVEAEWKQVATAPRDRSQALWNRFCEVRDELRRRVDAYLDDNLKRKEALCIEIESVADSTNWAATVAAITRMQAEWKEIGPVRQKFSTPLFERFRSAGNRFFERRKIDLAQRKERRQANLERARQLCEEAESKVDSLEWDATANTFKRLQEAARSVFPALLPRRRPNSGPSQQPIGGEAGTQQPSEGEVLQQRFRAACDRFFERYRRRGDIENERKLVQAQAIVESLASLRAELGDGTPTNVAQRVEEACLAWRGLGELRGPAGEEANQNFRACLSALEEACPDELSSGDAESLRQREKLCQRLERLATTLEQPVPEPSTQDLAQRLRLAMAANTIGGSATPPDVKSRRDMLDEVKRLEQKWRRFDFAIGARARQLNDRFEQALARVRRVKP